MEKQVKGVFCFLEKIKAMNFFQFHFSVFLLWAPLFSIFTVLAARYGMFQDVNVPFNGDMRKIALFILFVAPIFETLFLNMLPIEIFRKFKVPIFLQFVMTVTIFAIPHFNESVTKGFFAGIYTGSFLVLVYLSQRSKTIGCSFLSTIVFHFLTNAHVLLLAKLLG